jgi:beta-glucanase (GH16 family)
MEGLHTYSVEWTPDVIIYSIDGAELRRATPAEAEDGKKWPQTPAMIKLGTWVGGKPGGAQGTIDWAGGLVHMDQAPFVGWYKEIRVTDYCGGKDQASQYVYSDASGTQSSIKVEGSTKDEGFGDSKSSSSSSSSTSVSKPTESKTNSTDATKETGSSGGGAKTPETQPPNAAAGLKVSSTLAGLVVLGFLLWA